jgi:hypothetical protein
MQRKNSRRNKNSFVYLLLKKVHADSSVMLLQPVGKHLAILFVGIHEAHVAGMAEQMPSAVGDVLIK